MLLEASPCLTFHGDIHMHIPALACLLFCAIHTLSLFSTTLARILTCIGNASSHCSISEEHIGHRTLYNCGVLNAIGAGVWEAIYWQAGAAAAPCSFRVPACLRDTRSFTQWQ